MRVLLCAPDVEVIGQSVSSFMDNLNADEIIPLLKKHNIYPVQPDKWYPAQVFLDVLNELSTEYNMSSNFIAVGMAVVEKMRVPPEMEKLTAAQVLMGWDDLYKLQHRGPSDIGTIKTEMLSDNHVRTIHRHIYPDDFSYGIAYGIAKRWRQPGQHFKVTYANSPRMDEGGEETYIDVVFD